MLVLSGSPPSHCHRLLHNYYSLLRFSVSKPRILSTIHYFHCNYALFPIGIMYAFLSFSAKERLGAGGTNRCQIIMSGHCKCRMSADIIWSLISTYTKLFFSNVSANRDELANLHEHIFIKLQLRTSAKGK